MIHRFHMPTDVRCGPGAIAALAECQNLGQRPAILCGKGSARKFGHLDTVLAHLPGALVLEGVPENPCFADCEGYVAPCRDANIDIIIALGGGSVMDCAKALALLVSNDGTCADFMEQEAPHGPLPLIAIPTTAGTGSEVTPYAVLVDEALNKKRTLKSPGLYPRLALLDPAMTRHLPEAIIRATGLDALSQAMEGMLSLRATPTGDLLAVDVCKRIHRWLPVALGDPANEDAREQLLYAAMLSGVIIAQTGTTLVHGMGYYYTLGHGIAHGVANALLLPPVFHWNSGHEPAKVATLAEALGAAPSNCVADIPASITDSLYQFYDKVHFSYAASGYGVPENVLAEMAKDICQDPYRFKNQTGKLTESDVLALYQASWSGSVDALRP